MTHPILAALGLSEQHSGTYFGNGEWASVSAAESCIEVRTPRDGNVLGLVRASTVADYETLLQRASAAFAQWRQVPAPRRGEAVRLCGEALRKHKDALGSLVSLEMGKIKPEGDGEVQEMIDIADFAVGQSRMLYGLSMHSERPGHRMYEQWHPLGLVGIISAFNFPVAVWAWNAFIAAMCGDISIWKPSPKVPFSAIASMRICSEALRVLEVLREDRRGQPLRHAVLDGDGLLDTVERQHVEDGREGFLPDHLGVGREAGDDRRSHVVAGPIEFAATEADAAAHCLGLGDGILVAPHGDGVDQWPHQRLRVGGIAHALLDLGVGGFQLLNYCVMDRAVHDQAPGGGAALARRAHRAEHDGRDGQFQVGVFVDDDGVVAT